MRSVTGRTPVVNMRNFGLVMSKIFIYNRRITDQDGHIHKTSQEVAEGRGVITNLRGRQILVQRELSRKCLPLDFFCKK